MLNKLFGLSVHSVLCWVNSTSKNTCNLQSKICDYNMLVINLIFVVIMYCLLPKSKKVSCNFIFVISLEFLFNYFSYFYQMFLYMYHHDISCEVHVVSFITSLNLTLTIP